MEDSLASLIIMDRVMVYHCGVHLIVVLIMVIIQGQLDLLVSFQHLGNYGHINFVYFFGEFSSHGVMVFLVK